jgi:biotin operon repressor
VRAARLDKSERLQRVLSLLQDGREHSTMDIIERANVCAVNSIISELRANGQQIHSRTRERIWYYQLEKQGGAS